MPLIKNIDDERASSSNADSPWKNPNSIVRNTLRVRNGEFALIKFISDRSDGDVSRFHPIPGTSPAGKSFTEYKYCVKRNVDIDRRQIVTGTCEYCASADGNISRTSPRYAYWVFTYAVFHPTQNPSLGKYEDAKEWPLFTVGRNRMFREDIMKPQLLGFSYTTFEMLDQKAKRVGTLLDGAWEYSRVDANQRTTYLFEQTNLPLPPIDDADLEMSSSNVPEIELVAAGAVDEWEFTIVSLPGSNEDPVDEAMDAAMIQVTGEDTVETTVEETPPAKKPNAKKAAAKK